MRKLYICDSNIPLFDKSFYKDDIFKDGEVALTLTTISEIDHIKERSTNNELKYKARSASRVIEKAIKNKELKVIKSDDKYADKSFSCYDVMDDLIISTIVKQSEQHEVVAVSRDLNFRLKCEGMGIKVINYEKDKTSDDMHKLYSGVIEAEVFDCVVDDFYSKGYVELEDLELKRAPYPNEFIIAQSKTNKKKKFLARFIKKSNKFEKLRHDKSTFYGFKAEDVYQKFALELLYDDEVKIVTITSPQGTGKSFITMGAMLDMVVEQNKYEKLLIGKNTTPLDKYSYQGYTSGTTEEKLMTHFNNYLTTIENLHTKRDSKNTGANLYNALHAMGSLDILDISSILGSSFNNKCLCIDESQSFNTTAMRSILTRISDSCKLCVIGDIRQQTMTNMMGNDNGLYASIEWLKEVEGVGHITLKKGYRGKICDSVSEAFDRNMFGE